MKKKKEKEPKSWHVFHKGPRKKIKRSPPKMLTEDEWWERELLRRARKFDGHMKKIAASFGCTWWKVQERALRYGVDMEWYRKKAALAAKLKKKGYPKKPKKTTKVEGFDVWF